jgi:hypothetical protein
MNKKLTAIAVLLPAESARDVMHWLSGLLQD